MANDKSTPRRSKMDDRAPWYAEVKGKQVAHQLQGRRWVGSANKKFRVHADWFANQVVRRLVHSLGYRYILFDERLPGSPHLCFPSRKIVIFTVNRALGKFSSKAPNPSSRSSTEREAWELLAVQKALQERGWQCEIISGSEALAKKRLERRLKRILTDARRQNRDPVAP
jgi:G:T-mismatch repair DNA endonuclease (very short patch repair protein)